MTSASSLPPGFLFGVATAGFQIEGGMNGPDEPANNWVTWERCGRVEPSGAALDFWNRFEDHLDRVAALGCDSFRLSVEWARVEPDESVVDHHALARYGEILDACHDRGLIPLVTLHHFTHPAWLGPDLWLRPDAPRRFAAWVARAVDAFGDRCQHWVTLNEVNVLAVETYVTGSMPPGRRGEIGAAVRALDNLLAAHVLAMEHIRTQQADARAGTNTYAMWIYELDRLLTDTLAWRAHGVARRDLADWLAARRAGFERQAPRLRGPARFTDAALRRLVRRALPLGMSFPRTLAAVEAAESDDLTGTVQVDYYDPIVAHHFRLPGHASAGGRRWEPVRGLWDDPPDPGGLVRYCAAVAEPGTPLWVAENGLGTRVRGGRPYPRLDGWSRERYLRENLGAVVAAHRAGVPVAGYWHWTLADNYEWGSYEPRFGLFGVDRDRGGRWSNTDATGADAAGAYRRIINGLRAGDDAVVTLPAPRR
jgi:beta-glucosidase